MGTLRKKGIYALIVGLGAFVAFVSLFPLIWMALSGFKRSSEVLKIPFQFFPSEWRFEAYGSLLGNARFLRAMLVTGIGGACFTFLVLIVNSMAAYAFARLNFWGGRILWGYAVLPMFIPSIAILVPSFIVIVRLHLLNTYSALIIPGVAAAGTLFFIRQFYLGVPLSTEEAARIDGASRAGIYLKIFLPMSMPPFVIMGIGSFLGYWNAYVWPVMTISDESKYQIMQFMSYFRRERGVDWSMVMAGSSISCLPPLILFMVFQRYIVQGIKISGLK